MNGTQWKTLTEFIAFLGHEGICRVENTEKGWFINLIDKSPEATKKLDATMKRERLEKGEADLEDRLIQEQIERARQETIEKQLDAAMPSDAFKDQDFKEEEDVESSDARSGQDQECVKMEDVQTAVPPEENPAVISPITLQKPLKINTTLPLKKPTNPLKSSNPLALKRSENHPKSGMKKEDMNAATIASVLRRKL
jgi:DNA/RNA-binding protein KIN17